MKKKIYILILMTGLNLGLMASYGAQEAPKVEAQELSLLNLLKSGPDLLGLSQEDFTKQVSAALAKPQVTINEQDASGMGPLHWAVQSDNSEVVKLLLDTKGIDINLETNDGCTPLALAVQAGNKEIVNLLLDKQAATDTRCFKAKKRIMQQAQDALGQARDKDSIHDAKERVRYLESTGLTPLIFAARQGNEDIVKLLLEKGAFPGGYFYELDNNEQFKTGKFSSPESTKMSDLTKDKENIKKLIEEKANELTNNVNSLESLVAGKDIKRIQQVVEKLRPYIKEIQGRMPKIQDAATKNNNKEAIKILHDAGAKFTRDAIWGHNPLMTAVKAGNAEMVKLLLDLGFDVNITEGWGANTALVDALYGDPIIFKLLLEAGASLDAGNFEYPGRGLVKIPQLARELYNDRRFPSWGPKPSEQAIKNIEIILKLIERAQAGRKDFDDIMAQVKQEIPMASLATTPSADAKPAIPVARLLTPEEIQRSGKTIMAIPVTQSAESRTAGATAIPVAQSARLATPKESQGDTKSRMALTVVQAVPASAVSAAMPALTAPSQTREELSAAEKELMSAIRDRKYDKAQELLKQGVNPNIKDDIGYTPLIRTVAFGFGNVPAMVKALIEAKADVNAKDSENKTALDHAVGKKDIEAILIDAGAQSGLSADLQLINSASTASADKIKSLLAQGANVNAKGALGYTALHRAVRYGNVDAVRALIEAKADVNIKDNEGKTALDEAVTKPEIEQLLLSSGAKSGLSVNEQLMNVVAHASNASKIKDLLAQGVDVNYKGILGQTPLIRAAKYGNEQGVKLLLEAKADTTAKDSDGKTALDYAKNRPEIAKLLTTS